MAISKLQDPQAKGILHPAHNLLATVVDSDNNQQPQFHYLIDVSHNEWVLGSNSTVIDVFNGRKRLRINGSTDHEFSVGDKVYLESAGFATGLHKVVDIPDSQTIIIDLVTDQTYDNSFSVWKTFRNRLAPRPDNGYGLYDGSTIISNLVNTNFKPNEIGVKQNDEGYEQIRQFHHEYYNPQWDFVDNYYSSGNVGFTGNTTPPFSVNDQVVIQQAEPQYDEIKKIQKNGGSNISDWVVLDGNKAHLFSDGNKYTIRNANNSGNNKTITISVIQEFGGETILNTFEDLVDEDPSPAEIDFDPPSIYNGRHLVTDVDTNNNIVTIDLPWSVNTPPINGTMTYANESIEPFLERGSFDSYYVFDGALLQSEFREWNSDDYLIIGGVTSGETGDTKFLASHMAPDTHKVDRDGHTQIEFFAGDGVVITSYDKVILETTNKNSTDEVFEFDIPKSGLSSSHYQEFTFYCGPKNLNNIADSGTTSPVATATTGSFPVIKDDTVEYDFYVVNEYGARLSEKFNVKIYDPDHWREDDCKPFELKRLVFKDRFGSFQGYLFYLLQSGEIEYERNNYRDGSIKPNGDKIDNRSISRGLESIYVDQEKTITLTTDYINEKEFEWVKELLDSPNVFYENDEYGELVPVVIDTDSVSIVKDNNRALQNIEFNARISNREIRQRN